MNLSNSRKLSTLNSQLSTSKGFTLIELLIVIAVLGILATLVLVAVNPLEQFARGRDSSRKSTVGQFANALEAYYTSQASSTGANKYPQGDPATTDWIQRLIDAGELKITPSAIAYSMTGTAPCAPVSPGFVKNGWCYAVFNSADAPVTTDGAGTADDAVNAIVYTRLESKAEDAKCASTENAFFLWSSKQAKAGIVCSAAANPTTITPDYTFL